MHEYRQALMRLRQGDSEREIARSGLMGRAKAARFRTLAHAQGWLEPSRPLPPDAEIAAALAPPRLPASAQSALAAYRPLVERWLGQGVSGVAIHAALVREHGFTVSVKPAASFPRAFRSGEFLPSLIEHGRPGDGQGGNGALASA